MKEELYNIWEDSKYEGAKIKILPSDYLDYHKRVYWHHDKPLRLDLTKKELTDEEKLDKIDLKVIERYLRKKKLASLSKK